VALLQAEGSRSALVYIEENTAWGTTPSSSATWTGLDFNSESFGIDINSFESASIRSDRMTKALLRGNRNPGGDFTFELGPNSHNLLIRHLLGSEITQTGSAPYVHEITGNSSLPAGGLSIVKAFTDIPSYLTYSGGRVDSCSFDFPQEGIVTGSASMVYKAEAAATAVKPYTNPLTYPSGDPYESVNTEIYVQDWKSSGSYTWTSSEEFGVGTAGRFAITNGLDANSFVLGSNERYSIPAGRRRIEGSVNLLLKDFTFYNDYIGGTAKAIRVKMVGGSFSHDWVFPNVRYSGSKPTPPIESEQGIRYDMPWRAIRHDTLGYDVICTITSDETITKY